MRLSNALGLLALALWVTSVGCDRLTALKDRFLGSSSSPTGRNAELEAIENLYSQGACDVALQKTAQLIQQNPNMAEAHYYQGLCHLVRAGVEPADPKAPYSEEEQASLDSFQRALAIMPRHAPTSIALGDLYSRRVPARRRRGGSEDPADPYVLALEAYQRAIAIDPNLPEAQQHYARFMERTGDLAATEAAYKAAAQAAATVPETAPDHYIDYGRFLAGPADRLDEAVDQFELARMFRQDDPAIQQEMAIVHARIGLRHFDKQEYLLAEEALRKAEALFTDTSVSEAQKAEAALAQLRAMRRR